MTQSNELATCRTHTRDLSFVLVTALWVLIIVRWSISFHVRAPMILGIDLVLLVGILFCVINFATGWLVATKSDRVEGLVRINSRPELIGTAEMILSALLALWEFSIRMHW